MAVSDYSSAEDPALVRAAQRGDMAAFEELVARHRDKLYARAYTMMRNEEEALDLSQEAWIKGWQRLRQFQGDASFGTWMTRIVINLCLDQLRRKKRQRTESIEESVGGLLQAVQKWCASGRLPPLRVLAVEAATGVSRKALRPDIYP